MNKLFKQLFVLIMIILFVGCTKDEHNNVFILQAEGFQQDKTSQKAGVSGNHTYWLDGDMVSINGMACSVSVTNNNEAVAYGIMTNDRHEYMAVYPAHVRVSNIGTSHIINVPKYYINPENNGCQVLDGIPLVAYHIGEQDPDTMKFMHVTAAITVRVKNERSNDIELDRIELINDQYRLCGNITIDISECAHGGTPTVLPDKIGVSDTVTIYFTNGTKHITGGSYADIQIPMIPVGTDNSNFTINIYKSNMATIIY